MFNVLIGASTFWILFRLVCQLYYTWFGYGHGCTPKYADNAKKLGNNISSITNGVIIMFLPLILLQSEYVGRSILLISMSYNIIDALEASFVYRLHHLFVTVAIYYSYNIKSVEQLYVATIIYSLTEISNIWIWAFYHKLHQSHKLSVNELKLQLLWFYAFRTIAFGVSILYTLEYQTYSMLIIYTTVMLFTTYWAVGIFKKIKAG